MNANEFAELSAGYALGALSPEDERAYLDALAAHPEWHVVADADAATAVLLAEAVPEVTPPAHLRGALLAQISGTPAPAPSPAPAPAAAAGATRPNRRLGRLAFVLAACLVVLAGVGLGAVSLSNWLNRPVAVVALEQIEGAPDARTASVELESGGVATAHWAPALPGRNRIRGALQDRQRGAAAAQPPHGAAMTAASQLRTGRRAWGKRSS